MPKIIQDMLLLPGEEREYTSMEGVNFYVSNKSLKQQKVRLVSLSKRGRPIRVKAVADAPKEQVDL